jgi:hypothetical protein
VFQSYKWIQKVKSKSGLDRVADGISNRVDRLEALGDALVPGVVKAVWKLLNG